MKKLKKLKNLIIEYGIEDEYMKVIYALAEGIYKRQNNNCNDINIFEEILNDEIINEILKMVDKLTEEELNADILGQAYMYLKNIFNKDDKMSKGEYYTPQPILELILNILDVQDGNSVYDPCCGSGGVFVAANKKAKIRAYGQECNPDTWKLAKMNMHVHGIELNIGSKNMDTLKNDNFPNVKFDFIISNPPFNLSPWSRDVNDKRWQFGVPPIENANYAWLQHMFYHLNDNGRMGVVLTNSSLTTNIDEEKVIRKAFVDNGHVEAIITLPRKLFYSTTLPPCIWFISKEKTDRILFIDSSKELKITEIYDCFNRFKAGENVNIDKYCSTVTLQDIVAKDYTLFPSRYINYTSSKNKDFETNAYKLGELADWKYGRPNVDKSGTKYPVYGSSGIIGYTDAAVFKGPAVIVGRKGDIGSVYFEKDDFSASDVVFFTNDIKGEILLDFLYYEIKNIDFSVYDEGCGIPSLTRDMLENIEIEIPNTEGQQEEIKKLDLEYTLKAKKIEEKEKAWNSILAEFEKLRSKAVNSINLEEIAKFKRGCNVKEEGDTPLYDVGDIDNVYMANSKRKVVRNETKIVPAGTLVASCKGKFFKSGITTEECMLGETLVALEIDEVYKYYLFCYLQQVGNEYFDNKLTMKKIKELNILMLAKQDVEKFNISVKELFYKLI